MREFKRLHFPSILKAQFHTNSKKKKKKKEIFPNNHTELFENFIVMKISFTFCKRPLNVYFS